MLWKALALIGVALGSLLLSPEPSPAQVPLTGHPRLWVRDTDLARLRSWAVASNPVYQDGLAVLAAQAKTDMDAGRVPNQDDGTPNYDPYPSEMYAELFAFMSLISGDQATRDDYAQRARTCLMYVMNEAAKGVAAGQRFRDPGFSTGDRSRWQGEGFGLTVDWIYPYLSAAEKATIRQVFLRWIDENLNATTTSFNHPEPIGVVNDPVLLSSKTAVRWATNNYYTAHMRNIGLMALSFDLADDEGNTLRNYLGNATGAWLYVVDHALRQETAGGLVPEGFEYGPQTLGYIAQFLLALHTAGQNNPTAWGAQVRLFENSFWDDVILAYQHSLSPATVTNPDQGQVYQPAWYGDSQNYYAPDFIGAFGALGLYDADTGNTARQAALRWMETNMAPGGPDGLTARARDGNFYVNAILYFLLFDPAAPTAADPRPAQPLNFFAPGLGRLLARTGWQPDATWFTYKLTWNETDHQTGDGNQFEFYRGGEWLTKERTGYDLDYGSSDNHNTLSLQNTPPFHNDEGGYRNIQWQRGSQWTYVASGDPQVVARSFGQDFVYVTGDATNLYNSTREGSTDILHASRSIVWLKPDHIVVYDRAVSQTAGRFKRFWLNLPAQGVVSGNVTTMTTAGGQRLHVTTVLPTDTAIGSTANPNPPLAGTQANYDPMAFRLQVDAPGGPGTARFLHVLQGADAGTAADAVTLVQSSSGTSFVGVLVNTIVVLFPVDLSTSVTSLAYTVPATATAHRITGLTPGAGYRVTTQTAGGSLTVTISPGGPDYLADSGGVLVMTIGSMSGLPMLTERPFFDAAQIQRPRAAPLATPSLARAHAQGFEDLFNSAALQRIDLLLNSRDWEKLKANFQENEYYPADLRWNGQTVRNAGIRSRGLGSRSGTKPWLRVDFNRYAGGQTFLGLGSIVLDNLTQDPSGLRERVAMRFYQRMGLPAPREAHAALYVNNEYAGLYAVVESIDKDFLRRVFGGAKGNTENDGHLFEYQGETEWFFTYPGNNLDAYAPLFDPVTHENASTAALYAPLEAMFRAINESSDAAFEEAVGAYLDLPLFIKYVAVQNFLAQRDGILGYAGVNNFYLYRFENSSRSQFIAWDEDHAFRAADFPILEGHDRNVLMRRAMSVPGLRAAYFDALRAAAASAADSVGGVSWLEQEIQQQRGIVDAAMGADTLKPYPNEAYAAAADALVEFARVRPAFVRSRIP